MVACLGSGTFTQVNAIVEITNLSIGIPVMYTAAILTVLVAIVTIGGLKSIAMVAGKIVPFMALVYMLTTAAVLIVLQIRYLQHLLLSLKVLLILRRQLVDFWVLLLCWRCAVVLRAVFFLTKPV